MQWTAWAFLTKKPSLEKVQVTVFVSSGHFSELLGKSALIKVVPDRHKLRVQLRADGKEPGSDSDTTNFGVQRHRWLLQPF
jgi:hypothetical protein